MNREPSQPPALAAWLLRHVCAQENREELIGDLLERFAERPSRGWFWSQVLTAILVGAARSLQAHWPQVCFAIAGTALLRPSGNWPSPATYRLWWQWGWAWGVDGLPWPLRLGYDLGFSPALNSMKVLPILAALLFLDRTFNWFSLMRTYLISFAVGSALYLAAIVDAFSWIKGPQPLFWPLVNFATLLVAAWVGCRLPAGARVYGVRMRFEKRTR